MKTKTKLTNEITRLNQSYEAWYYDFFHGLDRRKTNADVSAAMGWRQNFEELINVEQISIQGQTIVYNCEHAGRQAFSSLPKFIKAQEDYFDQIRWSEESQRDQDVIEAYDDDRALKYENDKIDEDSYGRIKESD